MADSKCLALRPNEKENDKKPMRASYNKKTFLVHIPSPVEHNIQQQPDDFKPIR